MCGVCDTPELWRGAAGLCACVRACAGAAESSHTYIHTKIKNHNYNIAQIVHSHKHKPYTGKEKPITAPPQRAANSASRSDAGLGGWKSKLLNSSSSVQVLVI